MNALRLARVLVLAAAAAACASPDGGGSGAPLGEDLFPLAPRTSVFVLSRGPERTIRVETTDTGAVLWVEGGVRPMRMDVRREPGGFVVSSGPNAETEVVRFGAKPGAEWGSSERKVRFDGWERLVLPGGTYDAARIRVMWGPDSLASVETWWFAPGTGLVRWRIEQGGLNTEELSIAR